MLFLLINENTLASSNSIRNAKHSKKNLFLDSILELDNELIRIFFFIPHQTHCYVWLFTADSKVD